MAAANLFIAAASGIIAALTVMLVTRNAERLHLVQQPNARSSHVRPTPTGGGIGIVLGAAVAGVFAADGQSIAVPAFLLASVGFATLGLWDDVRPLPAIVRLAIQLILVAVTLAVVSPLWTSDGEGDAWTALIYGLLTLAVVYWVNLFNFMDGIDGVAGSEALFLLLSPLALSFFWTHDAATSPMFWWASGTAAAVLAFLCFNWPPAKIFMGDVGSTFLGFLTAAFALAEIAYGWLSPCAALILAACFVTDGTLTLLRRALQGENVMTAHRRHAYQQLARRFGSHRPVVLALIAINLIWLAPLAVLSQTTAAIAPFLVAVAYAPLAIGALAAGAGRSEHA